MWSAEEGFEPNRKLLNCKALIGLEPGPIMASWLPKYYGLEDSRRIDFSSVVRQFWGRAAKDVLHEATRAGRFFCYPQRLGIFIRARQSVLTK